MYRNINNYYFNRPNPGYAYANPYGMNFSRSYPRVVIYNGQQNFNDPNIWERFNEALTASSPYDVGNLQLRLRSRKGKSVLPEQLGNVAKRIIDSGARLFLYKNPTAFGDVYAPYEKRARYRGEEPSFTGFIKEAWNWPKHERDSK